MNDWIDDVAKVFLWFEELFEVVGQILLLGHLLSQCIYHLIGHHAARAMRVPRRVPKRPVPRLHGPPFTADRDMTILSREPRQEASTSKRGSNRGIVPRVVNDRYELGNSIGKGATSVVYSGKDRLNQEEVAVKEIQEPLFNRTVAKCFLREIAVMQHMNHPNVLTLKGVLYDNVRAKGALFLITDLRRSNLRVVLKHHRETFSSLHLKYFLFQILRIDYVYFLLSFEEFYLKILHLFLVRALNLFSFS